jgi:DNA polymerase-3 subunit gamma/tau
LYRKGADPSVIIGDMLDLSHLLTKLRAVPTMKDTSQAMAKEEMQRASDLATKLSMPALGRVWQILLKGLNEVNYAPVPQKAAEMLIIRLAYSAELPDPADLIKKIQSGQFTPAANTQGPTPPTGGGAAYAQTVTSGGAVAIQQVDAMPAPQISTDTLAEMAASFERTGAILLSSQIYLYVHQVKLEEGRLEFRPSADAPPKLAQDLTQGLKALTGKRWFVSVSDAPGLPTLAEAAKAAEQKKIDDVMAQPLVKQVFEIFPDAQLKAIRRKEEFQQ